MAQTLPPEPSGTAEDRRLLAASVADFIQRGTDIGIDARLAQ